jgi:hypothetical protein
MAATAPNAAALEVLELREEEFEYTITEVMFNLLMQFVLQDLSVMEFVTQDESRAIHIVCPAKSRTLKVSPGSTSTILGSNRTDTNGESKKH